MLGMDYIPVFSSNFEVSSVYNPWLTNEGSGFTNSGSDSLTYLRCALDQSNDTELLWAFVKRVE